MEIREITDYEVMLALEVFNREFKKRVLGDNIQLQEKFVAERPKRNKEILQDYIDGKVKIFGLYLDDGTFAGTVMLDGDKIRHLAIRKYWHNMGYGTALLNYVCDYAKKQGLKKVRVEAIGKSLPLYERNGFKIVGDLVTEEGNYPNVKLEKEL